VIVSLVDLYDLVSYLDSGAFKPRQMGAEVVRTWVVVYCSCQAYPTETVRSRLGKSKRCTRGTEILETTVEFFCYMIVRHTRSISYNASRMRTSLIASKGIVSLPAPCNAHCRVFSTARLPVCSRGSLHIVSKCSLNRGVWVGLPMACSFDNHDLTSLDQIVASVIK